MGGGEITIYSYKKYFKHNENIYKFRYNLYLRFNSYHAAEASSLDGFFFYHLFGIRQLLVVAVHMSTE